MATPVRTGFALAGADGGPLRGDVRTAGDGGGRPAVVICHGFKGFKDWGFFPVLADRLARAGLTVVSFNFSASGVGPDGESFSEPERFRRWTYSGDLRDLDTVVTTLAAGTLGPVAPPAALGLFGHSRGGAVATIYAAEHTEVRRLVTWSAIARVLRWGPETVAQWRRDGVVQIENARTGEQLPLSTAVLDDIDAHPDRLDVTGQAARVRAPWLIVHGEQDVTVPVADAEALAEAAPAGRLVVVPRGSHTFGARHPWGGGTAELDQAMEATVDWFTGLFGGS